MKLIQVRMKVLLTSEEQMEMQYEHDFGTYKDEDKKWVYRETGILATEIYRIIRYNKTKTIIQMYDDIQYLVDEPFMDVFKKWEGIKTDEEYFESEFGENIDSEEEEDQNG